MSVWLVLLPFLEGMMTGEPAFSGSAICHQTDAPALAFDLGWTLGVSCVLIACNVLCSALLFRHFRRAQQQLHSDVQDEISELRADLHRTADDLHASQHQAEEGLTYLATVYGRRVASHAEQLDRLERYVLASFEEKAGSTHLPASVCFAGLGFRLA